MIVEVMVCLVVGVADGDTLTARCGEPGAYQQLKVRISAIDAPEKAQAFGDRSRLALRELCLLKPATIRQTDTDRYGRAVADVSCADRDVATEQVGAGLAWVFDRYADGHQWLYKHQDTAKNSGLGLWADPTPTAPWTWRASRGKT